MNHPTGISKTSTFRLLTAVAVLAVAGSLRSASAGSGDTRSGHYRVIAGSTASVAGTASSPLHQVYVVGGSGAAVGIAAMFIETHQDPDQTTGAEGPTMVPLKALPGLLENLLAFDRLAKARPMNAI